MQFDQINKIRLVTLITLVAVLPAFVAVERFRVFTVLFGVRARLGHMAIFLAIVTDLGAVVESVLEVWTGVTEIIGISVAMVVSVATVGSTAARVTVTGTLRVSGVAVVHLTRF